MPTSHPAALASIPAPPDDRVPDQGPAAAGMVSQFGIRAVATSHPAANTKRAANATSRGGACSSVHDCFSLFFMRDN